LWILNFGQHFKPNFGGKYDVVEVDELCTFLKNEAKNDGFARNFVNFRLVRVRFASGFLIIGIQGRYLISRLEIEDSKPQKNSSQ